MARAMSMAIAFVMAFTVVQAASAEVLSGRKSLGKKDVNMGGLKDPHAMLTEIEDIVQSGETPAFDLLSKIKSLIVDEMQPGLTTIRDLTSQDTLDLSDAIQMCNNESKAKELAIEGAIEEDVDDKRSLHAACRDEEIMMYNHNLTNDDSYCIKLGKFLHDAAGLNLHIPAGANRDASVQYVEMTSDTNMCGGSEVRRLADSCAAKEGELSSKSDDCDAKQASFEVAFCTWKTQLESNCETLDSCHAASVTSYDKHVAKTRTLVTKWDAETATLQKILCYLNTWLNEIDAADNRSQHNASHFNVCRDNQTYTPLPVNYGARAEKVACLLTSVANFPGTSGFITQEYNNFLDFIHAVVPCVQATTAPPTTVAPSTTQARTTVAPTTEGPTTEACPWQSGNTDSNNKVLCTDGAYVTNWQCGKGGHGQRLKCPPNAPKMCASKVCGAGMDHCCEAACDVNPAHGGERPCPQAR